jgi:hypothetical protein
MTDKRQFVARVDAGSDRILLYCLGDETSLVLTTHGSDEVEVVVDADTRDSLIRGLIAAANKGAVAEDYRHVPAAHRSLRSADEIAGMLVESIRYVYERPEMHVGSLSRPGDAHALDVLLSNLHSTWAAVLDCVDWMIKIVEAVKQEERCGGRTFDDAFRSRNPSASEAEVCDYVLAQWHQITDRLGMTIGDDNARIG